MYQEIDRCRISGSHNLIPVLSLGTQSLTGVFPKEPGSAITEGPLDLVWCPASGLLQLKQSYDLREMYGLNYGYRSGLNQSMVAHLHRKVRYLERLCPLSSGDVARDRPADEVADRHHADRAVVLHHRKMHEPAVRHDGHAFVDGIFRSHKDDGGGHDRAHQHVFRGVPLEDHLAGIIALRHDADQLLVRAHEQRANALQRHLLNGLIHRLIGIDGEDAI